MIEPLFTAYEDRASMGQALAGRVAMRMAEALEIHDAAGLILSGGGTPKPLFAALKDQRVAWEKITLTLADDRWVPPDHEASNERLVRADLLHNAAQNARFISLVTDDPQAKDGEALIEDRLRAFPWPAALVLLGMGNDGHTASLFPGSAALSAALDPEGTARVRAITPGTLPKDAPYDRMSLTVSALLSSHLILLMINGDDKRATYERALAGDDRAAMPIRAILQQNRVPVEVHWAP
ncbi:MULTISPECIES: 6-phosphogluconolactonase [unclassified Iodidimonas]|jgi:6-phosphogluconolactonase|uniref:6-phosphogluconolactonase n=1 Tax=unclassified Iodidimonas TaxID=2626145 RepID=UPI002482E744|nr:MULTISPECIES: 6-phosphogluconolactonase [unclassified Iodidimonas]